ICQNSGCTFDGQGNVSSVTAGSAFFGMTERTAVSITSTSGNVRYNANPWASVDLTHGSAREAMMFVGSDDQARFPNTTTSFTRVPGTLRMTALRDDVLIASKRATPPDITLAPTDNGTVELLAMNGLSEQFVLSSGAVVVQGIGLNMLDVAADF